MRPGITFGYDAPAAGRTAMYRQMVGRSLSCQRWRCTNSRGSPDHSRHVAGDEAAQLRKVGMLDQADIRERAVEQCNMVIREIVRAPPTRQ